MGVSEGFDVDSMIKKFSLHPLLIPRNKVKKGYYFQMAMRGWQLRITKRFKQQLEEC